MTKETNSNESHGSSMYGDMASDVFMEEKEPSYRAHPAISNSDLKYLHTPRLFQLNKQRKIVEEEEEYHRAGTLIDEFLLNKEEFNDKFIKTPEFDFEPSSPNQHGIVEYIMNLDDPLEPSTEDKVAAYAENYSSPSEKKALKMYSDLKPYIAFKLQAKGKQEYSEQDWEDLKLIERNARRNPVVNRFLFEPMPNDEVFKHLQILNAPIWGVEWKGELDLVLVDHSQKVIYNVDLKSTAKPAPWFAYAYNNYKYYRQQALYLKLLKHWILTSDEVDLDNPDAWRIQTVAIVAEKTQLQKVYPVKIPTKMIVKGTTELREAAEDIQFYNEYGWDEPRSVVESGGFLELDFSQYFDEE